MARLSNCWNPLRALTTKQYRKLYCGRGNSSGYGNNVKDWEISSQALQVVIVRPMRAVHRLNVSREIMKT